MKNRIDNLKQIIEKEKKIRQYKSGIDKFVNNELREQFFTRQVYQSLTLECDFIAHYDRKTFYKTYFLDLQGINSLLEKLNSVVQYKGANSVAGYFLSKLKLNLKID